MSKKKKTPRQSLSKEELNEVLDVLLARSESANKQGNLNIRDELVKAVKNAKSNSAIKRRAKQRGIDREERARESELKNVQISNLIAQTKQLEKPWWQREPIALLGIIVSALSPHVFNDKPAEVIPIVISVNNDKPTSNVPLLRYGDLEIREARDPTAIPHFMPVSKPLPAGVEKIIEDSLLSLNLGYAPDSIRARTIQKLEQLKKEEVTRLSKLKPTSFAFSRVLERHEIQNMEDLIEFFENMEVTVQEEI